MKRSKGDSVRERICDDCTDYTMFNFLHDLILTLVRDYEFTAAI